MPGVTGPIEKGVKGLGGWQGIANSCMVFREDFTDGVDVSVET